VPINDPSLPPVKPTVKPPTKPPANPPAKPPVTPPPPKPAEPDPLASLLSQQETPVTYQTVMPELAKVFYGGKDFSSAPQKLNEQGQLVQKNPLLKKPNFLDPTKPLDSSALAPQGNPKENDVAAMLTKIMGSRGDPTSQQDFMNYFGRA
jgi:hypothetical protein